MSPTLKPSITLPYDLTVEEFVTWCPDDGQRWQLVDGEPVAMAPTRNAHGALVFQIGVVLNDHFRAKSMPCRVFVAPGVIPRLRPGMNYRIPDLGVVCGQYPANDLDIKEPVLLIEVLSPSNARVTRANLWAYITLPSVTEVLLLHVAKPRAELLRRSEDGTWPAEPIIVTEGEFTLESVGCRVALPALYAAAGISPPPPTMAEG